MRRKFPLIHYAIFLAQNALRNKVHRAREERLPSIRLLLLADIGRDFRCEPKASFQPRSTNDGCARHVRAG